MKNRYEFFVVSFFLDIITYGLKIVGYLCIITKDEK